VLRYEWCGVIPPFSVLIFFLFWLLLDDIQDFEGSSGIIQLAKDPIANYVVKRALDCSEGHQREGLFAAITANRQQMVCLMCVVNTFPFMLH